MKRILTSVLLFIGLFSSAFAQTSCNSQRYQDTIFHNVSVTTGIYFATATPFGILAQPQDLYLDIYEPTGDTLTKRPIIVFQFGGGFVIGSRNEPDIPQFATYFAQLGYVVASIDYRIGLNPLDTGSTVRAFYRGVQDERSAIRFLAQNAAQFKLDTNYLILTGTSAGCFCAFANAFMTDTDRPGPTFGTTLEPDDMGCMDCSGNTAFGHRIPRIKAIVNQWGAMLDTSYIDPWEKVPVISFHGDQDILVPYTYGYPFSVPVFPLVYGSLPIHQRMDNLGLMNVLHPLVGYSHEPELLAPQLNDTIYNYGRKFLFPIIRPQTSDISGDSVVCSNAWVTYSVLNTIGSWYCWQLTGNGTIMQNNNNAITVAWNDTGMVSVSVTELNEIAAEGITKSFQTYVVPHARAAYTQTINQLQLSLLNASTYATVYLWNLGNGDTSSAFNATENYTVPGNYSVQLIAQNQYCSDTFTRIIDITDCPTATYTLLVGGNGLDISFANASGNATSYFWDFGNGDTSNVSNPAQNYSTGGTYTITLIAINQYCSDTFQRTITIDSCPVANFTYQLNNQSAFFYADTTNSLTYSWSFGDGDSIALNALNVIHQYPHNGPFDVILRVKNQLGCVSYDTVAINIGLTGIADLNNNHVSVLCDPNHECLIWIKEAGNYQLEVFDAVGRQISKQQIESNYILPISNFSSGLYFLRISNSDFVFVRKFIKE
ncbi:MAG: hypothetical protein JWO06_2670 [Bacteroidota bacterium]|nr:hypothetical protein [Bacteroidota bacterium]